MQITNLHPGNVRMNDIFSIQKQSHKRCEHIINSGPIAPQSGILQLLSQLYGRAQRRENKAAILLHANSRPRVRSAGILRFVRHSECYDTRNKSRLFSCYFDSKAASTTLDKYTFLFATNQELYLFYINWRKNSTLGSASMARILQSAKINKHF